VGARLIGGAGLDGTAAAEVGVIRFRWLRDEFLWAGCGQRECGGGHALRIKVTTAAAGAGRMQRDVATVTYQMQN